jgi:activator of HSP90 ATPase
VNPSIGFPKASVHPQTKPTEASSTQTTTTSKTGKVAVNTTTVTASDEFRTTAGELYSTFTDPQRIAAFTRGPPRQFDGAQVGGKFAIFDGNVTGEFVTLNEPKQIVQKWRLAQWPEGHFSSLEINFDQNDIDGVTQMRVTWSGVPVGQEDVTKQNWDMYYVRSIKQTFGYVTSSLPLASLFPWIIGISLRFLDIFANPRPCLQIQSSFQIILAVEPATNVLCSSLCCRFGTIL